MGTLPAESDGTADQRLALFAIREAESAASDGRFEEALEWLESVDAQASHPGLLGRVRYGLARLAMAEEDWELAKTQLKAAIHAQPEPLYQERLRLLRHRRDIGSGRVWQAASRVMREPQRLVPTVLQPQVIEVQACGCYYSGWSPNRSDAWSQFLRLAKDPPFDPEAMVDERDTYANVAGECICSFVVEETDLLRHVDWVVPIPANPGRYVARDWSLPDVLARQIESRLAVPAQVFALKNLKDVELRGLSKSERAQAVKGAFRPEKVDGLVNHSVLLVDDVMTTGATLRESGSVLRAAGVRDVFAVVLSHTEG